jgi:predicted phosphodiesterase
MSNFDVISDTHIDHHLKDVTFQKAKNYIKTYLLPKDFDINAKRDVICLAGDIFDKESSAYNVFKAFKVFYNDVVYVYGNHECYVYSKTIDSTEEKLDVIRDAARANGVHMLEGTTVTLNGVTFGGSSAWYDFTYGYKFGDTYKSMYEMFKNYMSDADMIADHFVLPPYHGRRQAVLDFPKFLKKRMDEVSRIPENVDVMITHIGPVVPKALPSRYKDPSTGFYFFEGAQEVIRIQPKVWLYGHTHQKYDEVYHKTRMICNPYGYPSEQNTRIMTVPLDATLTAPIEALESTLTIKDNDDINEQKAI